MKERYPSVKTLIQAAPHHDRAIALRARKVLDGREPVAFFVGTGKKYAKLCAVDKVLQNHGIESVTFECQRENMNNCHDNHKPTGFDYSNTGDSYASTVVLYEGRFMVSGWADMLEWHERRCSACRKLEKARFA